jgi:Cu-processing system ATP-binding protein
VLGVDPAGRQGAQARRALGFLPENVAFHGAMTGTELMKFYARLKGQPVAATATCSPASARRGGRPARRHLFQGHAPAPRPRPDADRGPAPAAARRADERPRPGVAGGVFDMIDKLRADGATVLVSTHALAEVGDASTRSRCCTRARCCTPDRWRTCAGRPAPTSGCVCGSSPAPRARCSRALPDGVRCASRDAAHLELLVPDRPQDGRAAPALRHAHVEDVEMSTPGLEEVYRRLVADREGAQ